VRSTSIPEAAAAGDGPEALAFRLIAKTRRAVLDPVDRFSEIIFGLIMVLTFTGALRVAESGREQVREMLVAALGCNVAWGIVDGVMYVVTSIVDRARRIAVFRGIRAAPPERARAIVLAALPEGVAAVTDEADADRMAARARTVPELPLHAGPDRDDLKGALACALLSIAATFPPTLPFLLFADVRRALLVSNAVAVVSLFFAGYGLGKATGVRPWLLGLAMVLVGAALVVTTIALGG
jgi:VIT1/CCC1 family predicted Fe2+/Mn2+ transporter